MPFKIREARKEIPGKVACNRAVTQIYRGNTKEVNCEQNRYKDLSLLFAVPLSLLYLGRWLNDYTERIQLKWWIFASSILVTLRYE
ncbi:MAG: hypothetical protein R6W31_04550 [Bacteroidales bacterium]